MLRLDPTSGELRVVELVEYGCRSMEIRNTSGRPLKVPLPGGKRLFLAVGATGNVNAKAADHPALTAMVEAGDLELTGGAARGASSAADRGGKGPSVSRGGPRAGGRRSGDR